MNYACDIDVFTGWAEAVVPRALHPARSSASTTPPGSSSAPRAQGRIQRIEGLDAPHGGATASTSWCSTCFPVGAPRRNWKQTLISDGMIIVRHPDLQRTLEMADRFGTDLRMYAG